MGLNFWFQALNSIYLPTEEIGTGLYSGHPETVLPIEKVLLFSSLFLLCFIGIKGHKFSILVSFINLPDTNHSDD